jgi:hypothetical protein
MNGWMQPLLELKLGMPIPFYGIDICPTSQSHYLASQALLGSGV